MAKKLLLLLATLAPIFAMAQVHNHKVAAPAYHTVHKADETITPGNPKYRKDAKAEPKVYICKEGKALAYHSNNSCSGLKICGGQVTSIPKPNRKDAERAACIRCYATAR